MGHPWDSHGITVSPWDFHWIPISHGIPMRLSWDFLLRMVLPTRVTVRVAPLFSDSWCDGDSLTGMRQEGARYHYNNSK